jgi:hypothetical protein
MFPQLPYHILTTTIANANSIIDYDDSSAGLGLARLFWILYLLMTS